MLLSLSVRPSVIRFSSLSAYRSLERFFTRKVITISMPSLSPAAVCCRNLSDMKQEGKLNPEQFALAMYLVQQKQAGKDPPAALTPDMVPPSMRPKEN